MTISELADAAGTTPGAVRWYERTGVLTPSQRTANGYRSYAPADVTMLRLVVTLRRLGLRPGDAGRAARSLAEGHIDPDLRASLEAQLAAIARQRADLDQLEAGIVDLRSTMDAASAARASEETYMTIEPPIRVLFLCTGNSARSQMAEALLRQAGDGDFQVESAGTDPKGVNPYTLRVLADSGIDWSGARSKSAQEFLGQHWDYVITVCDRARQSCPVFPGQYDSLHWGIDDPADVEGTDEERLAAFRTAYLELSMRVRPFITLARRTAGHREAPVQG
jgi:thioredoxin type arsenate reductase